MRADRKFTVKNDGFYGGLYKPKKERLPDHAVIILQGSQGIGRLLQGVLIAEKFAEAGITALPIAYHGASGLPKDLLMQPVDAVENASDWLHANGWDKVGVYGISMGAMMAIAGACLFPEKISTVIAASPVHFNMQAEKKDDRGTLPGSSFAYHGKPLPYLPWTISDNEWMKHYKEQSRQHRDLYSRDFMEKAWEARKDETACFPVEKMRCPVIFLSGEQDAMCPSKESSEYMMKRLDDNNYTYPHIHYHYNPMSHALLPFRPFLWRKLKIEKEDPEGCNTNREKAWGDVLAFLDENWK